MALETEIKKLTAALEKNTAAIESMSQRPAPAAPSEEQPAESPPSSKGKPAAATPPPADTLDYEKEVKPLLLKIGEKNGRDALVKFLDELGVKSATDLTPEQYQGAVDKANKVLAQNKEALV